MLDWFKPAAMSEKKGSSSDFESSITPSREAANLIKNKKAEQELQLKDLKLL